MKRWIKSDEDGAGVYLLELDGVIQYVGQTHSFRTRLGNHAVLPTTLKVPPYKFKGLTYSVCNVYVIREDDYLKRIAIEDSLIKIHRTPLNNRGSLMKAEFQKFIKFAGSQAKAAKMLDLSPTHISLMASGKRKVAPELAERIELVTQGLVRKEALVFGARHADA